MLMSWPWRWWDLSTGPDHDHDDTLLALLTPLTLLTLLLWRWLDPSTGPDHFCHFSMYLHFDNPRVMAGTICQYYYTFGYLTMAGLAFLLNDSWQVVIDH